MKRKMFCVALLLWLLAGCRDGQVVETCIQTEQKPTWSTVETKAPERVETVPTETTPQQSTTKETAPKETAPKETAPKETAPKETAPKETAPKETTPEENQKQQTEPAPVAATMTEQIYRGLNYWLYTPADPTENMPLIVYLHGGSGKGSDLNLLTDVDGLPQYVKNGRIAPRAYMIFPQCPADQKGWNTLADKIESLIGHTCDTFGLNKSRVSLTGHSMGGTGTWSIALAKSYLFYKVAPMSGSVKLEERNIATLSRLRIWAVVGDADTIVDPQSSIDMVEALQAADGDARLTALEGADHFAVPSLAYLGSGVINWLIS